jgi:glutaredoxin
MRPLDLAIALALPTLMLAAAPAAAQYKWVAPNGAVTYSDQPPPPGVDGHAMNTKGAARSDDSGVPAALRDATTKYPVVLYTTPNCTPCQQARAHLAKRGVPFAERTVSSSADAESFRKAGFTDNNFPAMSVGRERSVGFESGGWDQLLDMAGYPKSSMLPPSFKQMPAKPLADSGRAMAAVGADGEDDPVAGDAPRARTRPAAAARSEAPPPQRPANTLRF